MTDPKRRSPSGYTDFIARNPDMAFTGIEPWPNPDMELVRRINREVNRAHRWKADAPGMDIWDGPQGYDCEDFAVEKMRQLLAAGVPRGALRFAARPAAGGRGHLVLTVNGVVMDSRADWLYPMTRAGSVTHIESRDGWREVTKPLAWGDLVK